MQGYVMPSWMCPVDSGENFNDSINNNFSLKTGQILNIKYPEETAKATGESGFMPILYDVMVNESSQNGRIQTIYKDCQIMDHFGGVADFSEHTLRPDRKSTRLN